MTKLEEIVAGIIACKNIRDQNARLI